MIESKAGERFVLEVNAVPGWKSINQALSIDTAGLVIELAESLITQRASI